MGQSICKGNRHALIDNGREIEINNGAVTHSELDVSNMPIKLACAKDATEVTSKCVYTGSTCTTNESTSQRGKPTLQTSMGEDTELGSNNETPPDTTLEEAAEPISEHLDEGLARNKFESDREGKKELDWKGILPSPPSSPSSISSPSKEERIEDTGFNKDTVIHSPRSQKSTLKRAKEEKNETTITNTKETQVEPKHVAKASEKFAIMELLTADYMRSDEAYVSPEDVDNDKHESSMQTPFQAPSKCTLSLVPAENYVIP
jgi:hypothetical protein